MTEFHQFCSECGAPLYNGEASCTCENLSPHSVLVGESDNGPPLSSTCLDCRHIAMHHTYNEGRRYRCNMIACECAGYHGQGQMQELPTFEGVWAAVELIMNEGNEKRRLR